VDAERKMSDLTEENRAYLEQLIVRFREEPSEENIINIEKFFSDLFHVPRVKLWRYDETSQRLIYINDPSLRIDPSQPSLVREALRTEKAVVENHLRSNRSYNPSVDNPLDLPIRALLIIPVLKEGKPLGVIKLFSMIGDHTTFPRSVEHMLAPYISSLPKLFVSEGETPRKDASTHKISVNEQKEENFRREKERLEEENIRLNEEVEKLRARLETLLETLEESRKRIESLENTIEEEKLLVAAKEKKYKDEIAQLKHNEEDNLVTIQHMIDQIEKFKKENEHLKKQNEKLEKALFERRKRNVEALSSPTADDSAETKPPLKTQKRIERAKYLTVDAHQTIDEIVDQAINIHQRTRMLFDTILFSLYSHEGTETLEMVLEAVSLVENLMSERNFTRIFLSDTGKQDTETMIERLKNYQYELFNDQLRLNVQVAPNIPKSVYVDTQKVSHAVLHLLLDLYQFVDHTYGIRITVSYEEKILKFKLSARLHEQNKLVQNIFKKGFFKSERDKTGYFFAAKLIALMNGKVEQNIKTDAVVYSVEVPAPIIRMADYTKDIKKRPSRLTKK
jgi:hypothetical protein